MSDFLNRMKALELETKVMLPRKTNTVIRLDGKAFHSFTRGLKRPFDHTLVFSMNETALELCRQIPGAVCAYVQSDEISVILTDYVGSNTEPWFGGSLQKIVSVSTSIATQAFNETFELVNSDQYKPAYFDARAFTVDSREDLNDYLVYRQSDAYRNGVTMIADHHFGHAALVGKNTDQRLHMLFDIGIVPTSSYPPGCVFGRFVFPYTRVEDVSYTNKSGESVLVPNVARKAWALEIAPAFREFPEALLDLLPPEPVRSDA